MKYNRNKHEIPTKSNLNIIETIISKTIQDSDILQKDYVFINDEVNRYLRLKKMY